MARSKSYSLQFSVLIMVVCTILAVSTELTSDTAQAEFPPGTTAAQLPTVAAWGYPQDGMAGGYLGDGSGTMQTSAVPLYTNWVVQDKEMSRVDGGLTSACALAGWQLTCWGDNSYGQLGNGGTFSPVPAQVNWQLADVPTAVSVGARHACALAGGKVYCWGDNTYGQLGTKQMITKSYQPIPVLDSGALAGKTISAISAGYWHTCVIADADVYCWGLNSGFQLGDGTESNRNEPVAVSHGTWDKDPVNTISAGLYTTCAVTAGRAYCWGANQGGQVGNGSDFDHMPTPVKVDTSGVLAGLTVNSISVGGHAVCALAGVAGKRNAYCWGYGKDGALGNGTLANSNVPVAVSVSPGVHDHVSSVSVDTFGGCLIADGHGYCWGTGTSGRIGDGTTNNRTSPVAVNSSGVLANKRLTTLNTQGYYTLSIGVYLPGYTDVPKNHPFFDDISWLTGTGISRGSEGNKYEPTTNVSRQAMAAFLFRYHHPGIAPMKCQGNKRTYLDVPASNQFCGAIETLATEGVLVVPPSKKFDPITAVTRAAMADWIYRTQHPTLADQVCLGGPRMFVDVPAAASSCGNIEWLAKIGVTNGFPDNSYHPTEIVSRQAMAAFLHRAQELNAH